MPKFDREDRVIIPGNAWKGIQGVIVDGREDLPGCPMYQIYWVNGIGEKYSGWCSERDLLTVNFSPKKSPKKPATKRKR